MLKIGADPELFVRREGRFISGHVFPCGTKRKPRKTKHGAVQNDGLALELNIPPAETKDEFVTNVRSMLKDITVIVKNKDKKAEIVAQSSAPFDPEYLSSLPEYVSELGCNEDYSAYTMEANPRPDGSVPFRTGAGHIHLGWTEGQDECSLEHFQKCASLVRELDYFVGLPLLKFDPDDNRRKLYGKAGAFRPKPYGCEYRVPSNVWISKEEWWNFVFVQSQKAYERWQDGRGIVKTYRAFARDSINHNVLDWDVQKPDVATEIYV